MPDTAWALYVYVRISIPREAVPGILRALGSGCRTAYFCPLCRQLQRHRQQQLQDRIFTATTGSRFRPAHYSSRMAAMGTFAGYLLFAQVVKHLDNSAQRVAAWACKDGLSEADSGMISFPSTGSHVQQLPALPASGTSSLYRSSGIPSRVDIRRRVP